MYVQTANIAPHDLINNSLLSSLITEFNITHHPILDLVLSTNAKTTKIILKFSSFFEN